MSTMKARKLGASGLAVSTIGLGMGSTTTDFGDRDDEVNIATIRHAIDLGVTLLDTADRYWDGRHERLVGQAIKGRRNEVVLCSKFGNIDRPDGSKAFNGRPEYVPQACDGSLKRLGVDVIDLYYLHRVDPSVPIEDTIGAMADLVCRGKVRHLGISEVGVATLRRAHRTYPLTALQTEYSLWARDVEPEILPTCRELGIGFVAYSPLGRGLLAGRVQTYDDLAAHDVRRTLPRFQPGNLERNLELLKPVEEIAKAHGVTTAQVALAWLLAQGTDIVPIPGTKQEKYVDQNVAAVDLELSPAELTLLAETFKPGARAGDRYDPQKYTSVGL